MFRSYFKVLNGFLFYLDICFFFVLKRMSIHFTLKYHSLPKFCFSEWILLVLHMQVILQTEVLKNAWFFC